MNREKVEEALRGFAVRDSASDNVVEFSLPDAKPMTPCSVLSTYYDESGFLVCIAVDARSGPQVDLDGIPLVGRVPSELEDQFTRYLEAHDRMVIYSQFWDPSSDVLGIIVRAQRVDDVVLSRPVFVSRDWADRCGDVSEGRVPRAEWQRCQGLSRNRCSR